MVSFLFFDMTANPRVPANLSLVGFMGTGKSSTGHLLAEMLQYEFVDTDALIEHQAGESILELFARSGEAAFRRLEAEVATVLEGRQRTVISTGGGFILNPANLESLRRHSLVVCLWASPEAIFERVRHQHHRPLLKDPDPLGRIRKLLAEREPFYRKADVLVNTDLRSTREVALQVLHHFQVARS